ncbi:Cyclin-like F-box [Cordyceps javanica]|uniref:Cyclin-like F-box n=1 Tax=Cordyceps javanica TaxID=43265 RepID=A0A545UTT4_9HYPO|nr:Cyclin-like F-box [Cordyceps javanica]TQW04758.1 Cyclin-like F-box [Cordyceps javanica]
MSSNNNGNEACLLLRFPKELLVAVTSYLANSDIKRLRGANRAIRDIVPLRLQRVFLSANPLNIQVFRAIADHDDFRKNVTEIVWDDARLVDADYEVGQGLIRAGERPNEDCPEWFKIGRRAALMWRFDVVEDGWNGNTIPEDVMSLDDCWQYYRELLLGQNEVLNSDSDVEALQYGLQRFPSLKCITLTPAAHGVYIGNPLYQTPMLRAFPDTFAYPIPRGWPGDEERTSSPPLYRWNDNDGFKMTYGDGCTLEEYKNIWRGFRVVLRTLSQHNQHSVSEFVMAIHHRRTGMNCHIFDQPCQEYVDFASLLSRPGFRRLDLALYTGAQEEDEWPAFRTGLFRDALSAATDLEHFSLSSNMDIDVHGCPGGLGDLEGMVAEEAFPISVLPVKRWPHLQHFGITGFLVLQSELVALLQAMSFLLRSVEVSYRAFFEEDCGYTQLLVSLRDNLSWRERAPKQRPRLHIKLSREYFVNQGRYVSVDRAANKFIYDVLGEAPNPFGSEVYSYNPVEGLGAVDRSHLAPSFEVPYALNGVNTKELVQYQAYY